MMKRRTKNKPANKQTTLQDDDDETNKPAKEVR